MSAFVPGELHSAARDAVQHRRYPASLLTHLDALESDELRAEPWLALLQGRRLCRMHSNFAEATPLIDAALAAFQARDDQDGELWAMAEWSVMRYHADEFEHGLDGVLPLLDRPNSPICAPSFILVSFCA